jgi:protocatechuate 3,4-dioxygenase beta subunit
MLVKMMGRQPVSRREMLGLMGTAAAVFVTGCERPERGLRDPDRTGLAPAAATAAMPACIVRPEQTEGPYFLDEKLNRADVRSEPADGSVKPGVSLRVIFDVSRVDGAACAPLNGAIVDLWQCDATGVYSGVRDMAGGFDTRGEKFLRGFQVTGVRGTAEFLTIYPGWYPGRAVHIHFKIRAQPASERALEFTSQLYFDEAVTDHVHRQSPYNAQGRGRIMNDADSLFRRGGKQLMPAVTKDVDGYTARFGIGLEM